jgi:hypothetical protein
MNKLTDRGIFDADGANKAGEGAQPVGTIDHFGARDAWEQILGPARKTTHFVREGWPKYQDMIVFQRGFIDLEFNIPRQSVMPELAAIRLNLRLRDAPKPRQC